ncbi:hypothetical protein GO491_08485 [Flavobacteriaceae bacterium Ap0902]|nr:hypothetical protein [Flavobacteriaceae bacterium Ap0902]
MKKLSPNLIGFLLALLICIGSLWIYFSYIQRESIQLIDNPTQSSITVEIDDETYSIAASQHVEVNLSNGTHTLKVESEIDSLNSPSTAFIVDTPRGVINPIRAKYFIFGMPYGPEVDKDSIFRENGVTYEGKKYQGDVRIDSSLYIKDFYYNLNEDFPPVALKSENKATRKKIFRESDFKQFYFERYE